MRAAGDTVDPVASVALAIAMLTLQPTGAPQQCCCVGISHGGTSVVPTVVSDAPRSPDAEPAAPSIGMACPDIDTSSSLPAELAMAE